MKKINDLSLEGKKVVIRVGFDVPLENGKVVDDKRIMAGIETIQEIAKQKPAVVVLISHLGRPGGEVKLELSNKPVAEKLAELLEKEVNLVETTNDLEELILSNSFDSEKVYFFENLRFLPGEKKEVDEDLAKQMGKLFDVYVNDAFSNSHRDHMSMSRLPKYTEEKCIGLLFEKEFENLSKVKDSPENPAVAVIGGAKIETKLPVIESLLENYDKILVGGKVANEAIDESVELGEKVLLPIDFAPEGKEDERLDIGPKTIQMFAEEIEKAKTIVWNGPMGKFEDKDASEGTKKIMQAVAENSEAEQVVGGGETLESIKRFGDFSDFDYVSMSGGAMLEFLAGKELPAVKALEE